MGFVDCSASIFSRWVHFTHEEMSPSHNVPVSCNRMQIVQPIVHGYIYVFYIHIYGTQATRTLDKMPQ